MTQQQKARVHRLNPVALPCDDCGSGFGNVFPSGTGRKRVYRCGDCEEELRVLMAQAREEFDW